MDSRENQQMTEAASARTQELQWQFSERHIELLRQAKLIPATQDDFRRELTACIALCMPAGFDESARREWLLAAWGTLEGIPADLLADGCKVARQTCDHPSKVVPAILREVKDRWESRRRNVSYGQPIGPDRQLERHEPNYVTPEEASAILREFGFTPKYAA